jgi:phage virion morphogenesis protein
MNPIIEINDETFQRNLNLLKGKMSDLTPFFRDIGNLIENQARSSFDKEAAPSGASWKPSQRKVKKGGKTLTKDGHLVGSLNHKYGRNFATIGVNRPYAGAHQFGGIYKISVPAHQRKMTHVWGKKVPAYTQHVRAHTRTINMPKRAYLPENESQIKWAQVQEIFNFYMNNY